MSFDYRYKIRINLEEYDVAPEKSPTLTFETFEEAVIAAKPWIDAEYTVEIAPIPVDGDKIYIPLSLYGTIKTLTSKQAGRLCKAIIKFADSKNWNVESEELLLFVSEQLKIFGDEEVEDGR